MVVRFLRSELLLHFGLRKGHKPLLSLPFIRRYTESFSGEFGPAMQTFAEMIYVFRGFGSISKMS